MKVHTAPSWIRSTKKHLLANFCRGEAEGVGLSVFGRGGGHVSRRSGGLALPAQRKLVFVRELAPRSSTQAQASNVCVPFNNGGHIMAMLSKSTHNQRTRNICPTKLVSSTTTPCRRYFARPFSARVMHDWRRMVLATEAVRWGVEVVRVQVHWAPTWETSLFLCLECSQKLTA